MDLEFKFDEYKIKHWFPGHMLKAMKELQSYINLADFLIILLDARLPYSSYNLELSNNLKGKPRILLALKSDLANKSLEKKWIEFFKKRGEYIFFTDKYQFSQKQLLHLLDKSIFKSIKLKFNRPYRGFIVGVPNVGKSSLINKITTKKRVKVANKPGVTLHKEWVKVNTQLELLDTPGIMIPKKKDAETELKFALANIMKQSLVGYDFIAHYIIYLLFKNKHFITLKSWGIEQWQSREEMLEKVALHRNVIKKESIADEQAAAQIIVSQFNNTKFPSMSLENPDFIIE